MSSSSGQRHGLRTGLSRSMRSEASSPLRSVKAGPPESTILVQSLRHGRDEEWRPKDPPSEHYVRPAPDVPPGRAAGGLVVSSRVVIILDCKIMPGRA